MSVELEWKEKYRPNCLDDLIVDDKTLDQLRNYFKKRTFPSSTFAGVQGIGKTTIARLAIKELNAIPLFINASKNNNIDTVRGQITEFTESQVPDGVLKIVLLDEVDGFASEQAWKALRGHIEECADDTRFILTCNYPEKIPSPIVSRCNIMNFTAPNRKIFDRLLYILEQENIKLSKDDKKHIIHIIKTLHPDIRTMISHLERCCVSGEFVYIDPEIALRERDKIISFVLDNLKDHKKCRKYLIENETKFDKDYIALAGQLFDRIYDSSTNVDEILFVSDRICRMHQVTQPEIEFSSMIIELGKLKDEKRS